MLRVRPGLRFALAAITAVALLAAGCGGAKPADTKPAETKPAETKPAETKPAAAATPVKPAAPQPAAEMKLDKPVEIRIATGGQATAWYGYGATLQKLITPVLPAGSKFDVLPQGLGIANVKLIDQGKAEIGFSFPPVARWAADGTVAFDAKVTSMVGLVGGIDTYYMGVVVDKKLGIKSLQEVKDKKMKVRIGSQPKGSLSDLSMRIILEAYGMSLADIEAWGGSLMPTDLGVVANNLKEGKLDMIISVFTPGHPTFTELSLTHDVVYLPLEDKIMQFLLDKYGVKKGSMPPNTFPKQTETVPMPAFPTSLYAAKSLPDAVAYTITKTVVESKPQLEDAHKSMKVFDPKTAAANEELQVPLHPGAAKYYKEKGLIK